MKFDGEINRKGTYQVRHKFTECELGMVRRNRCQNRGNILRNILAKQPWLCFLKQLLGAQWILLKTVQLFDSSSSAALVLYATVLY